MTATLAHLRLVEPPPAPLAGETLDERYVIERVLGEGGMGIVYLARHRMLNKPVAIKVLRPDVSRDDQIVVRFQREARAASAIGSPHICDVSDFGTLPDGSTYFVMEMLDGPSLSSVIGHGAPLDSARTVAIATQLCEALGAAHAAGIVHRDLKPDNVHLVPRGDEPEFVKVLDFGIAKIGDTTEAKITVAGQVFGTPHYMSPEQCAGYDVDARTDVYALGVMLYEMACGQLPFDADNLMGLLTKHVYEQPIAPRDLGLDHDVPPGLEAIILRCLQKKSEARYASMAALRADLVAFQRNGTPKAVLRAIDERARPRRRAAPSPAAVHQVTSPAPTSRKKMWVGGLLGLLVLALSAGGGLAYATASATSSAAKEAVAKRAAARTVVTDAGSVQAHDEIVTPVVTPDEADAPVVTGVTLSSTPSGAEVYGPDGSLLGNTPLLVARPAAGEPTLVYALRRSGRREREVPVGSATGDDIHITMTRRHGRTRPSSDLAHENAATQTDIAVPTPDTFDTIEPVGSDLINPFADDAEARQRRRPDAR